VEWSSFLYFPFFAHGVGYITGSWSPRRGSCATRLPVAESERGPRRFARDNVARQAPLAAWTIGLVWRTLAGGSGYRLFLPAFLPGLSNLGAGADIIIYGYQRRTRRGKECRPNGRCR
jgi:hypothetical protein